MASIPDNSFPPKCWICRKVSNSISLTAKLVKKNLLKYIVFFVLLTEVLSIFLNKKSIAYPILWYPLLTNLVFIMLFANLILLQNVKLRLCLRKRISIWFLLIYYLIGVFSLIFSTSFNFYVLLIKYLLLGAVFVLMITTINENIGDD